MSENISHPFGEPITILTFSDSKKHVVDNESFEKIFNYDEIQDRKIVILSTIGAFRGGKSFFLNYCLRFLYAHFPSVNNPNKVTHFIFKKDEHWMGNGEEILNGFSWRSGTKRDTTGIIMWSDVFLHTIDRTGEKIAIFVMDTQGLFDNDSTPTSNSKIFALGTLIPSIQILNLKNIIQEDQLEYLQFATEFTQFFAMDIISGKPFQNLMFLIRDWSNDDEYKYGTAGGDEYLKEILKSRPDEKNELRSVRKSIASSFEQIRCCLLPHPGKTVATNKNYDGRWSEMDEEFRGEMKSLIEHLLLPEKMILKKITSKDVTVKEIKEYSQAYFRLFESNGVTKISSIYELTVESYMNNVMEKCINDYKLTMYRNKDLIDEKSSNYIVHENCKERALKLYDEERKMGSIEYEVRCRAIMSKKIDMIYKDYENQSNQEKQKLQADLDKEKQKRMEAENAKKIVEKKLKELSEKCEDESTPMQTELLNDRLQAETQRIQEKKKKDEDEEKFRKRLLALVAAAAVGTAATCMIKYAKSGDVVEAVTSQVKKALTTAAAASLATAEIAPTILKAAPESIAPAIIDKIAIPNPIPPTIDINPSSSSHAIIAAAIVSIMISILTKITGM